MANLTSLLKSEMSRLARKELRGEVSAMKKANSQHRRDIAALKRQVQQQQRTISFLQIQEKRRLATNAPATDSNGSARFSPVWLKAHRERLGFSAADYANRGRVDADDLSLGAGEIETQTPSVDQNFRSTGPRQA